MSDETLSRETLESLAQMHVANPQNEDAFEELFRRLRTLVYWRVRAKLPHHAKDEAYDVVQEVFRHLLQNIDKADPSRPFLPWFQTLADHIALDYSRRLAARPTTISVESAPPDAIAKLLAEEMMNEDQIKTRLHRLMGAFPSDDERLFAVELCKGNLPFLQICGLCNFKKTKGYELAKKIRRILFEQDY